MKFLVNNERTDLVVGPGQEQSAAPPAEVNETEVNSEIELLTSRDLLDQIVMDHKLYFSFMSDRSAGPSPREIEKARQNLSKRLSVSALRKTNIIDVTYRGASPDAAVAVLEDVRDRYQTAHLLAHSASGSERFFTDQVDHYGAALAHARAELADFHQRSQLFSMPEQQLALVQRLESVSFQLKDVRAQIRVAQARSAEGSRQLAQVPERIVTQVKETSDQLALQQLEPALAQLENRRIELATKFRATDRLVVELDNQIVSTQREIARIREERMAEETSDLDSLHQSIKSDVARSEIDLSGLLMQREQLEQQRREYDRQLGDLDQSNLKLQDLDQVEKQARDSYDLYTRRLNEARLAKALDHDKISNVVMIEKPVASPIAVWPNLPLNLLAGLIVGLLISTSVAVIREVREAEPSWPWDLDETGSQHVLDPSLHVLSGK